MLSLSDEVVAPAEIRALAFGSAGEEVLIATDDAVRRWTTPASVKGTPEHVRLWAQVVGGMELDAKDSIKLLSPDSWRERQRQLQGLGRIPDAERTVMVPPLQDRRRRLPFGPFGGSAEGAVGGNYTATGG
jgi:hypothetical protein